MVTIIPTDLVTNSLLSSFSRVLQTEKQSDFQQVGGLFWRNFSLLFIASRALPQSHIEFSRLLFVKEYSYMLFLVIL